MSFDGKVAKLSSDGEHCGSAWLFSKSYALTALHCVRGDDGTIISNLTLKFYQYQQEIEVTVEEQSVELDIALLKLTETPSILESRVFPLSRHICSSNDKCLMRGHPSITLADSPDGRDESGVIVNPTAQRNNRKVIELKPSLSAGSNNSTNLQGISGGPVVIESNNQENAVIGVVIEESMNGNRLDIVSILDIADNFPIVKKHLEESPHISSQESSIWIDKGNSSTNIKISASFNLNDLSSILNEKNINIYCFLKEIDLAADSLFITRFLSFNSAIVQVNNINDWSTHEKTKLISNLPRINPSPWEMIEKDIINKKINNSINSYIKSKINESLYKFLYQKIDCGYGYPDMDHSLRNLMYQKWLEWQNILSEDNLSIFIVRIFSTNGKSINLKNLENVWFDEPIKKQILESILFSLAIACIDNVNLSPDISSDGNLKIGDSRGHVCGLENQNHETSDQDKALYRIAAEIPWATNFVVLPMIKTSLLSCYEKRQRMMSSSTMLKSRPPVAITGEPDFIEALVGGVDQVKNYYQQLINAPDSYSNFNRVRHPTEILND